MIAHEKKGSRAVRVLERCGRMRKGGVQMIPVAVGAVLAVMLMVAPAAGAPAPVPETGTVRIFVFPRTQPELEKSEKKRLEKEAKSERKRAEKARKDVNKALEARYGKKEKGLFVKSCG